MAGWNRLILPGLAILLWVAALPYLSLVRPGEQRWILFLTGAVLMILALTRKHREAPDPGPFRSGLGQKVRPSPLSLGPLFIIAVLALVLRLVTLGQPVAGDDPGFPGFLATTSASSFLARLPLAVCGALTPVFLYLGVRRCTGEPAALLIATALSVAPAHVALSQTLGEAAPAILLLVLSTFVLDSAITWDRPLWWWLYGILLAAAVPLGPWTLALLLGHAAVVLGWSLVIRISGYPLPPVRNFLIPLTLVSAFQAFYLTAGWHESGLNLAWIWLPMGIDHGPIPVLVWSLAVVGLLALPRHPNTRPVFLLLAPAAFVYFLVWFIPPFSDLASLPWPLVPVLILLSALGLVALLKGVKFLASWIFPGRISWGTLYRAGIVVVALLLALAMLPGLKSHYHRTAQDAAVKDPGRTLEVR